MTEYKGFRADRLRQVMKLHEVTVEDIVEHWVKFFKSQDKRTKKMFLEEVIKGYYYEPSLFILFIICDACNCSADYLLGLSDEIY